MKSWAKDNKTLLYKYEAVKARLDIRDFFLQHTVRLVYDNVGQVLSLVRMQLAVLGGHSQYSAAYSSDESPGYLVGQSIRDLRLMCKSFYPDADILSDVGMANGFRDVINILYKPPNPMVRITGVQREVEPNKKLIAFKMIQEILVFIKESGGKFNGLIIAFTQRQVQYTVLYEGEKIQLETSGHTETGDDTNTDLSLQARAQLIDGSFKLTKGRGGTMQVKLYHPLTSSYE